MADRAHYFEVVHDDGEALEVVTREEYDALEAENARLRARLAEYDKYIGDFTSHA